MTPPEVSGENTVVIVEEATQVSAPDAEPLCGWAAHTVTALVFVGDPSRWGSRR